MSEEPLEQWEGSTADELADRWSVPEVHLFRSVASTNDVARRLAAAGAAAGTVVIAEEQTAGRGRAGRSWASPPGLGLWISLIARPPELPSPGALPLRVGIALAGALAPFAAPVPILLKWPNDLIAGGGKIGGILCESTWAGTIPAFVVVGVGLNIRHSAMDFPEEIRGGSASLRTVSGDMHARLAVAGPVIAAVGAAAARGTELSAAELAAFECRDALRGLLVDVTESVTGAPLWRGRAGGLGADGALLLDIPDRTVQPVHAGTVRTVAGAH